MPAEIRASLPSAIAERLRADDLVDKAGVAGPGFINLTLKPEAWMRRTSDGGTLGRDYGRSDIGAGVPVNVEYVSANPTGPMHVGHGRGAVFGDALASLLGFTGFAVTREYYINDAGVQVDALARSAYLRYREALGETIGAIPEGLYPGDYLKPVGAALAAEYGGALKAQPEAKWLPVVRDKTIDMMMAAIRADLAALNIDLRCLFFRTLAVSGRRRPGCQDDRMAPRSAATSMKAACRRRRARRSRTGRIASRLCSVRPSSATTSIGR